MTAPREYCCYDCGEPFASAQAVRAHVRFCWARRARLEGSDAAAGVPRHVPRHELARQEKPPAEPELDVAGAVADLHRMRQAVLIDSIMGEVRWRGLPPDLLARARAAVELEVATLPAFLVDSSECRRRAEAARDRALRGE